MLKICGWDTFVSCFVLVIVCYNFARLCNILTENPPPPLRICCIRNAFECVVNVVVKVSVWLIGVTYHIPEHNGSMPYAVRHVATYQSKDLSQYRTHCIYCLDPVGISKDSHIYWKANYEQLNPMCKWILIQITQSKHILWESSHFMCCRLTSAFEYWLFLMNILLANFLLLFCAFSLLPLDVCLSSWSLTPPTNTRQNSGLHKYTHKHIFSYT